jgi:galactonate dehydratase
MKITDLKTFVVHAFRCNWVFVRLYTDAGITGVGEATVELRELTVAQAIQELGRYLVGQDPFPIEHHVHMMNRDSYWRSGVILRSALSAVEAAMFDIKGKALGVPVYDLLGGRCRDRIKCYANGWFAGARTPAQFAEKAAHAVSLGFRALKFDPFGSAYLQMSPEERRRAVEVVEAVREGAGPDVDLLVEVHGRLDVPTAVMMAKWLEPCHPYWYEEPVPPESLAALADVRSRISIPVAAGERFYDYFRADEALRANAVDVLQPDVCHVGGLIEAKRICDLARLHCRAVSPHNPNGPVANAMTLQLAAVAENFVMLETMMTDVPWRADVVPEDLELVDGHLLIPDKPGLGVDLNESEALKHPYIACDLRHYSGALTDIRPADSSVYYRIEGRENVSAGR